MDEETETWRNQEADLRSKAGTQIRSSDIKARTVCIQSPSVLAHLGLFVRCRTGWSSAPYRMCVCDF